MRESLRVQQQQESLVKPDSDDESLADLDEVPSSIQQMPPKVQSYIYASNDLTDEFLFGDDIMIDQVKTKKTKKSKGGPKSFVSDTVSSLSDDRAITDSSS